MTVVFRRMSFLAVLAAVPLTGCATTGEPKVSASAPYITALNGGIIARSGVTIATGDRQRALEAEYRALEAAPGGQPVVWSGRGLSGEVVAAAPYQVGSQNCRQYTHTVTVDGRQAVARGAACRNANGSWSPLS